jgi:hypothetical protein
MFAEPGKLWVTDILKMQRLENKVHRTMGNFPKCTPVHKVHMAFNPRYVYGYITILCRQQTEVVQNHWIEHICSIGEGAARHRKCMRPNLGGGHACDHSSD